MSPPARVAWIEIGIPGVYCEGKRVATREGGVDRNLCLALGLDLVVESPPARVAWIEISKHTSDKGGGDSRHPRGWRG